MASLHVIEYRHLSISKLYIAVAILGYALLGGALQSYAADAKYAGSDSCKNCHQAQHALWQGSHHDLAMQPANSETVLGNFGDTSFDYNGITTRFSRRGDKFIINTDGEDGKLQDFEVAYVFGVYPLQQYLLPLSRGRLQALTIAWDARPASAGGQRWYHLYPDEVIDHKDPLHWTGPYLNWNTRCAECHSTDLQKNYDAATRSFNTTFKEVNVGCEACHGPGEKHLALAAEGKLKGAHNNVVSGGFPTALSQRGIWLLPPNANIATRSTPLQSNAQIDNCARCHARRGTLGDYHYGADLLDTHRLSLPQWPLYHPDGQINDEVYVYGSFVQSKMHQAGVVCSNCHEPHSLKLRAPDNGVCAQCHLPATYDSVKHHHHEAKSSGASCANCHMPETTYMGVDPRRDHSMRIPRPDLSVVMNTPNACNQCHTENDASWALDALRNWGVQFRDTSSHPGRIFHRFAQGDTRVVPQLAQIANATDAAPIWRATAMEALGQVGGREALQTATSMLYDDNPLLRVSTIRALDFLPANQRLQLLQPLLQDEVTAVRMEVASSLASLPLGEMPPEQAAPLEAVFKEYTDILSLHTDMPNTHMQLGVFYLARQNIAAAEAAYREAIRLNVQLIPAYLNLADLMRGQNQDAEARKTLLKALSIAPESGATLHALGLLETRSKRTEQALDYLQRAAKLETNGIRHRFVYGIALHDLGQAEKAIAQLKGLLRTVPQDEQILGALTNYLSEQNRHGEALEYARTLTRIAPGNRNYQQLYQQLESKGSAR